MITIAKIKVRHRDTEYTVLACFPKKVTGEKIEVLSCEILKKEYIIDRTMEANNG